MKRTKYLFSKLILLFLLALVISVSFIGAKTPINAASELDLSSPVSGFVSFEAASGGGAITTANQSLTKDMKLIPGGIAFGVKFSTNGIMVIGFDDIQSGGVKANPAFDAGIRAKDVITKLNGAPISTAAELCRAVEGSNGQSVTLTYIRNGKEYNARLTPKYCDTDGKYKTGLWVRDSGAGIGTVTYINPKDLSFGGLGHGICDSETGSLIPMDRGAVLGVTIGGVQKGLSGSPGEIKGHFSSGKLGSLYSNTDRGVFGVFSEMPKGLTESAMSVGTRDELCAGEAQILCTLDNGGVGKYTVSISDINTKATGNKCFTVTVTDKALIEKTGGIVQGMSGSPIIQNGKLVGAVTHVLINDPTKGYGIFIENMLDAAG